MSRVDSSFYVLYDGIGDKQMILWDSANKQILTSLCRHCPEEYFAPYDASSPHVGCCSYSPTFGLYEIYKMVRAGKQDFFLEVIYENEKAQILENGILVHATVDKQYHDMIAYQKLSPQEEEDLRLRFSVCQFFVQGKGCGLPPEFKNGTCRSFICMSVEEKLSSEEQSQLTSWVKEIRREIEDFENQHKAVLKKKRWSFQKDIHHILDYLTSLS